MYLAQMINSEEVKSEFYIDMFEDIIETKNDSAKKLVDSAILEAINVANGKKDILSISNTYYFLVTTLLEKFNKKLTELNPAENIPEEVYPEILVILR